jgi:hypothetical protein
VDVKHEVRPSALAYAPPRGEPGARDEHSDVGHPPSQHLRRLPRDRRVARPLAAPITVQPGTSTPYPISRPPTTGAAMTALGADSFLTGCAAETWELRG